MDENNPLIVESICSPSITPIDNDNNTLDKKTTENNTSEDNLNQEKGKKQE